MNFQIPDKRFKYILLSILFIVFIIVIKRPITIFPDSEDYLNMYIYRSAIYPIFLWVLKSIFGNYLEFATIFTQIIIGLVTIYFFVTRLKKIVKLNPSLY
jgi:hypothetical protein